MKPRKRSKAGWFLGMLAAIGGAAGCTWFQIGRAAEAPAPAQDPLDAPGARTEAPSNPASDRDPIVLRVSFDVLRVDLPCERIRHSLKIWNHLDESIGDPGQTALLARNGFRIGVGDQSAWPALRTIFEENEARSTRATHAAQEGLGLKLSLGDVDDGDTYFVHRRSGDLKGGTFRAGTKLLVIDYAPDETDPTRIRLTVTPEHRQQQVRTRLAEQGGEIVTLRDQQGTIFHELSASVTVGPGQFLVIGGSAAADGGYLLGSLWLNSVMKMRNHETLLFVSAQTTRTAGGRGGGIDFNP